MAWTTPRTWADGELVTASIMNTYVRDQLNYLNNERGFGDGFDNDTGTYTTTSTSYVLINAALQKTLTIASTRARVTVGLGTVCAGGFVTVNLYVDGVQSTRLVNQAQTAGYFFNDFILTGLTPGSRQFDLRWLVSAGTATLYQQAANGGTALGNAISFVVTEY